jgi:hypothetical protein
MQISMVFLVSYVPIANFSLLSVGHHKFDAFDEHNSEFLRCLNKTSQFCRLARRSLLYQATWLKGRTRSVT